MWRANPKFSIAMTISRDTLAQVDPEIAELIKRETERKEFSLELIPSENCTSEAVIEATGSILTDKYAKGIRGVVITADAIIMTILKGWREIALKRCLMFQGLMCSPIVAPLQIWLFTLV